MQTENNMEDPPRGWVASMFSQFRFFGWIVILATAYCLMVGSGLFFYAMSVLLELIVVNTGYSVAQISLANTIFLAMSGFAGVIVGELITRYDIRFSVTAGSLVLLLSYVLLAEANSLTAIYVIYGMIGIGYAMTALVPATTLVARWFIRPVAGRGFADAYPCQSGNKDRYGGAHPSGDCFSDFADGAGLSLGHASQSCPNGIAP